MASILGQDAIPPDSLNNSDEQHYRHLFQLAPICIFVIDLTKNPPLILEANRRAELVYGYPEAALVGMPAAQLIPEKARSVSLSVVKQVQAGQTVTVETVHQHRDGTCFPVRLIATPEPGDGGHMIVTVEDITAVKQRRSEAEAITRERLRIAQEIHDGVAQNLAALRFKSAQWAYPVSAAPPEMRTALAEVQDVLITAIADIRRAIFSLRPVELETLGLFTALNRLVTDFGDHNHLVARLTLSGTEDNLPELYQLPLFRIIQEGLNNIGQHAQASSILIQLAVHDSGGVNLSVNDNGRGFDPHHHTPVEENGRFGLRQMRERIIGLGGTLDVLSTIGQGTELHITLPPLNVEGAHAH
jgi:PAS domain S-box-containing protein